MVKQITTLFFLFLFLVNKSVSLETERTFWVPWTTEHTYLWEQFEQEDRSASQFRRNEYFEGMDILLQRDAHWNTFCNLLYTYTGTNPLLHGLGFAILDKKTHELLGTVRFNFSSTKGYVALSYGLKQSARHQKLGNEIAALAIRFIDDFIGLPLPSLKENVTKNMFMAEWHVQGKLPDADFEKLLSLFEKKPIPLQGIAASVDIINQPSLSILIRNGMKPSEVECTKYYLHEEPNLFCIGFSLLYPEKTSPNQDFLNGLLADVLSRDDDRIQATHQLLKNVFHVPDDWEYLSLNREDKALLKLIQSKIITTTFLSDIKVGIKTTQKYRPPYCFVQ